MQTQYYCYGYFISKTDFTVVKAHVDALSSALIWQHKLRATLPANRFPHQSIHVLPYCTIIHIRIEI